MLRNDQVSRTDVTIQPEGCGVNILLADFTGNPVRCIASPDQSRLNDGMDFPSKVRKLLDACRMSQADLAESLGTSQQQVSRWLESGKPPKADYLLRLARALGVTVDYLIDDTQDEPAPTSGLRPDEVYLVRVVRGIGLGFEEAVARLWSGEPGGKAREGVGGVWPTVADQDLSGIGRRDEAEKRKKSGLELEADADVARPDDVPPVGPKRRV